MDQKQVELQRNLYRLLLDTSRKDDISLSDILEESLSLIVRMTNARLGYLELQNASGQTWWSTRHCRDEDVNAIRQCISTSIIADALSQNETIVTPSAFLDPRFRHHKSVQGQRIESVLCSPFGDGNTRGLIYLQGNGETDFSQTHCLMDTNLFTRHVSPLLGRFKLHVEGEHPEEEEPFFEKYNLSDIIGRSDAMMAILRESMAIAELDVTVLLTGQSGTGKSIIAKAIHNNSQRCTGPFVHLNCANFPEQLVESELFGVHKGAHSGAYADIRGKIAAAEGGTLFLDEIGELPVGCQAKLLQFLEDGAYYPLGSRYPVKADVRIVTASNIDFNKAMNDGAFRQDLYYRIGVFPLTIPPLAERLEDIPALVQHFCEKYCTRFNIPLIEFSSDAIAALQSANWPGNIRQFENHIQQGIFRARTQSAPAVLPSHVFRNGAIETEDMPTSASYRDEKNRWERQFIKDRLEQLNWNVSQTARSLGLSRSYINTLLSSHGLQRQEVNERQKN